MTFRDFLRVSRWCLPGTAYRRRPSTAASILVCYPYDETLELAGDLRSIAICVAGNGSAVRAWVTQHDAVALVPADWEGDVSDRSEPTLPPDVIDELRSVIDFDHHNQFVGAGGKHRSELFEESTKLIQSCQSRRSGSGY